MPVTRWTWNARSCAAVAVVAAAYWTGLPEADACSCDISDEVRVHPPEDATEVPPNTRLLVSAPELGEVRLLEADTGANVPLDADGWTGRYSSSRHYVWARPEAPLAPGGRYEVAVDDAIVSAFEVGDAEDDRAPEFAGIEALDLYRFESDCVSSCWDPSRDAYHRVWADFEEPPDDTVLLVLELTEPGGGEVLTAPVTKLPVTAGVRLDSHSCEEFPPPVLAEGDELCARVVAYDGSGNAAGAGAEHCATVKRCFSECDLIPTERGVCPAPPDADPDDDPGDDPGAAPSSAGCAVRADSPRAGHLPAAIVALACLLALRPASRQRATAPRSS